MLPLAHLGSELAIWCVQIAPFLLIKGTIVIFASRPGTVDDGLSLGKYLWVVMRTVLEGGSSRALSGFQSLFDLADQPQRPAYRR